MIDDEPWFVGRDIAAALGYNEPHKAIARHVDEADGTKYPIRYSDQTREMYVINESGLYSLILSSKLPSAKEFKHWVTAEILPSLRKHGAYMTPETIEKALYNPDFLIKIATTLKAEQEKNRKLLAQKQELQMDKNK